MKVAGFEVEKLAEQPLYFALLVYLVALLIAGLEALANAVGVLESDINSPWIVMTSFMLFYTIFGSIFSLRARNMNIYWRNAIMGFLGLGLLSIVTSQLLSGISMDEAGSFRWLFIVLAIGFLVFLSIVRLMKRIVDIAIKQDERLRGGK